MRVLLDTNIIIHRENSIISNYSIGHLFYWLDKLKATKIIHQYSIREIQKYKDEDQLNVFNMKLKSYNVLQTIIEPNQIFLSILNDFNCSDNDIIDNTLLYEVYSNRVDVLITEDKKIIQKAKILNIGEKVYSVNRFIEKSTLENPEQVKYKMLNVRQKYFGDIDINSIFFDSFKNDYKEFEHWFNQKCDEIAYVCEDDDGELLGFLYLKVEDENENYNNIYPTFEKAKRLKVGTFKVESTGFRLGERFIQIIFDNALLYNVDEIYVTLFNKRDELIVLQDLLKQWGFVEYGAKSTINGEEIVLVKKINQYNLNFATKQNFPNVLYNKTKFILPIMPKYHTTLFPDSILRNESVYNFIDNLPHRYALQKVYISWAPERNISSGDLLLFYRMGDKEPKCYSAVVTTVGVVDSIIDKFQNKEDFLQHCQNRSVFTNQELDDFWSRHKDRLMIIKFIYLRSLENRLNLNYLWGKNIIEAPNGPRPFTRINDEEFDIILQDANTKINCFIKE